MSFVELAKMDLTAVVAKLSKGELRGLVDAARDVARGSSWTAAQPAARRILALVTQRYPDLV